MVPVAVEMTVGADDSDNVGITIGIIVGNEGEIVEEDVVGAIVAVAVTLDVGSAVGVNDGDDVNVTVGINVVEVLEPTVGLDEGMDVGLDV